MREKPCQWYEACMDSWAYAVRQLTGKRCGTTAAHNFRLSVFAPQITSNHLTTPSVFALMVELTRVSLRQSP
jgi:hypothetical protein